MEFTTWRWVKSIINILKLIWNSPLLMMNWIRINLFPQIPFIKSVFSQWFMFICPLCFWIFISASASTFLSNTFLATNSTQPATKICVISWNFRKQNYRMDINIRTGNARSGCCPLTRVWITMDTRPQIRSIRYESVVSGCPFCFPWIRTTLLQPSLQPRVLVLVPLMIWEITFRWLPLKSPSLALLLSLLPLTNHSLYALIHDSHTSVPPPVLSPSTQRVLSRADWKARLRLELDASVWQ